jgi:hypothetical protein
MANMMAELPRVAEPNSPANVRTREKEIARLLQADLNMGAYSKRSLLC